MPTLVWRRRPESGTDAAAREGSTTRRAAAVPDPVVSATGPAVPDPVVSASAAPDPAQVALPTVSSKRCGAADGGKKKKRKSPEAVKAAKKKSKAKPKRDLPTGVQKSQSGNYETRIKWGGKTRHISTFDTPEQASAAYVSARKDRDEANLSVLGNDEVDALFGAAKTKALESFGGFVPGKRDLPQGIYKAPSRKKFGAKIRCGGKTRHISTFGTPEQASAAYVSVKKDLDEGNLSGLGADEVNAIFDAAKKKAVEEVGGFIPEKRDLPTGVQELPSGKFQSQIGLGGRMHYIGTFDTPEQASAAFMSVKNDRGDAKLSALGADEANAAFAAANTKALEEVGVFVPKKRDLPRGVYTRASGKFQSKIYLGDKYRYIGTFDTPDQASAAFMSVRKDLDDAKLHVSFGANEVQADDIFDAAKKKALETVRATMDSDECGDEHMV